MINHLQKILIRNDLAQALVGDARPHIGSELSEVHRRFVHPAIERRRYPTTTLSDRAVVDRARRRTRWDRGTEAPAPTAWR